MKTPVSVRNEQFFKDTAFIGTEQYYYFNYKLHGTDGAKHVAEKFGAFWVMDIIWSILPKLSSLNGFYVCYAVVNDRTKKNDVTFYCDDGNYNLVYKQQIPLSDLETSLKLYLQAAPDGWIVMLPSEC